MSNERMIDYEALAQDAMRGVVRTVLTRTAKSGLLGDHHFYISFDTQAPGVSLSKRLKDRYQEEMTIVLQHRFWDLSVSDDRFEVKLTFDGIPERIVVPFAAIKVFFDPSVRYGLQFEAADFGPDATSHPQGARGELSPAGALPPALRSQRSQAERKPRAPRKPRADKLNELQAAPAGAGAVHPVPQAVRPSEAEEPKSAPAAAEQPKPASQPAEAPQSGAQVVSLDAFRKK